MFYLAGRQAELGRQSKGDRGTAVLVLLEEDSPFPLYQRELKKEMQWKFNRSKAV